MTQRHTRGFTLIEVMIVVVIVAILAAVAVPSYQSQIQKTRRADAKEALTRAAAAQERWFFSNNSYTNNMAHLGFAANAGDTTTAPSVDGHYILKLTLGNPPTTYSITAAATGAQEKDIACSRFKIDQSGLKTAEKGPAGSPVDNTAECWR